MQMLIYIYVRTITLINTGTHALPNEYLSKTEPVDIQIDKVTLGDDGRVTFH